MAVEGIEHAQGRRIVLFTTEAIEIREANGLLLREGFYGVMRLDEVRRIERSRFSAQRKTDYKELRALISRAVQGS